MNYTHVFKVKDIVDLRILQLTAGHSNQLCFDVQVSQKQDYKLLDDQAAGESAPCDCSTSKNV